jgi:hypothetical protein
MPVHQIVANSYVEALRQRLAERHSHGFKDAWIGMIDFIGWQSAGDGNYRFDVAVRVHVRVTGQPGPNGHRWEFVD